MKFKNMLALLLSAALLVSCSSGPGQESGEETDATLAETVEKEMLEVLQNQKHTLRFDENGEFRILILSDVQADPPEPSKYTLQVIRNVTEREDPDLVVFTGDNSVRCTDEETLQIYLTAMTSYMEENGIAWAHVFGNHDDENALARDRQQAVYESFPYCVSKTGPADIQGVSNYVLPVYSSDETKTEPIFAVWGMDTGNWYNDAGLAGEGVNLGTPMFQGNPDCKYAYMPFSQIAWYYETSLAIEDYLGYKLPGLMCHHIPIQEYYEVVANKDMESVNFTGEQQEYIGSGPLNSGLFTAMLERGDIKAVVSGHDHVNNYTGEYGGINLCYAGCISYDTYNNASITGGRVFVIHEDNPEEIETYYSYAFGTNLTEAGLTDATIITFEDESLFTYTEKTAKLVDGTALAVNGEATLTLHKPYKLQGRYVILNADIPVGSRLNSVSIDGLFERFTADLTEQPVYALADGTDEWIKYDEEEALPDGFKGQLAVRFGYFYDEDGNRAAKDTYILGYSFSTQGEVTVDDLVTANDYK